MGSIITKDISQTDMKKDLKDKMGPIQKLAEMGFSISSARKLIARINAREKALEYMKLMKGKNGK